MLIVNFKIHLNSEKNSAINGRMVAVYCSKIIEILRLVAAKNVMCVDQNARMIYKMQRFLAVAPWYYPKIFQIT